jgi:hypothetical protein
MTHDTMCTYSEASSNFAEPVIHEAEGSTPNALDEPVQWAVPPDPINDMVDDVGLIGYFADATQSAKLPKEELLKLMPGHDGSLLIKASPLTTEEALQGIHNSRVCCHNLLLLNMQILAYSATCYMLRKKCACAEGTALEDIIRSAEETSALASRIREWVARAIAICLQRKTSRATYNSLVALQLRLRCQSSLQNCFASHMSKSDQLSCCRVWHPELCV